MLESYYALHIRKDTQISKIWLSYVFFQNYFNSQFWVEFSSKLYQKSSASCEFFCNVTTLCIFEITSGQGL